MNRKAGLVVLLVLTLLGEIVMIVVASGLFVYDKNVARFWGSDMEWPTAINYALNRSSYIIFCVIGLLAILGEVIAISGEKNDE